MGLTDPLSRVGSTILDLVSVLLEFGDETRLQNYTIKSEGFLSTGNFFSEL